MSAYSTFFFATAPSIVQLQLLEFTHPSFSTTYRFIRNDTRGTVVTHEGGAGPFVYTYIPISVKPVGSGNDLDQAIEFTVGDTGNILPKEVGFISDANKMTTKPLVTYREYRSDDLTVPLYGPLIFRIDSVAFNKTGAVFKAKAASFNKGRVGVYYTLQLFPMLRAK